MHRGTYDSTPVWIQTWNGFLYHPQGNIKFHVTLSGKVVFTTFIVIPTSDQLQVKLGIPWLSSMQVVASPIHKYLKFTWDTNIININHSLYKPSHPRYCA